MRELFNLIGEVSPSDAMVLLTGESGMGKELVAQAIHRHSHREAGPLVSVNCAAIPEGLIKSELFGDEREAFRWRHSRILAISNSPKEALCFL